MGIQVKIHYTYFDYNTNISFISQILNFTKLYKKQWPFIGEGFPKLFKLCTPDLYTKWYVGVQRL